MFSLKGQIVSILGFAGCTISIASTQLCYCSTKAAIDTELCLVSQRWARFGSWATLSTLALDVEHFEGMDMERAALDLTWSLDTLSEHSGETLTQAFYLPWLLWALRWIYLISIQWMPKQMPYFSIRRRTELTYLEKNKFSCPWSVKGLRFYPTRN